MSRISGAQRFVERRLRHTFAPLHQRVHANSMRRAMKGGEPARRDRDAWWGGERRWFPGGTPPRRHNHVTPLVDGERFFGALHEALTGAQHYVYIIGWCLTPHIPLLRGSADEILATRLHRVLTEVGRRVPVRVLLWSGAPFLFEPKVAVTEEVQRILEDTLGVDLQCRLDRNARFSHCLHQKAIVIDGQVAFVGGMDLTTFQGDRWDTHGHHLRSGPNWHDVQVRIEGEAVADVEHNFRQRWQAVTGDDTLPHREPECKPSWQTPVQIVRTIPRGIYGFAPKGEYGIHYAHTRAIRSAQRLIYIENQYLWSPEVMDALIAAMNAPHSTPFRIVIVLPTRAYDGKWDNDQHVQDLRDADKGRGMVSIYCPYTSGPAAGLRAFVYRPTYVHAKVAVIDDEWLLVGSANLNNRGLITDGELVASINDPALARTVRAQLWSEHLALPRKEIAEADPIRLVDEEWTARAAENAAIIKEGDRPLVCAVHRYECGQMPGSWFLEEAESLTVEH